MSSDADKLPLIYKSVKYIRIKAIGCSDENNNPCAFYGTDCKKINANCTGIVFHLDPDPLNLITHRLIK